jgi:hypothetical protein
MSEIRVRDLRNKTLIYQLLRSLLLCRSLTCSVSLRMYVGVQIFERGKLLFAHLLNSDHVLSKFFYLTTERNFNLIRHHSTLRIQFPSLPKA